MSTNVAELLNTFDRLPVEERREAAQEILRRSVEFDSAPVADEPLIESADQVFLSAPYWREHPAG